MTLATLLFACAEAEPDDTGALQEQIDELTALVEAQAIVNAEQADQVSTLQTELAALESGVAATADALTAVEVGHEDDVATLSASVATNAADLDVIEADHLTGTPSRASPPRRGSAIRATPPARTCPRSRCRSPRTRPTSPRTRPTSPRTPTTSRRTPTTSSTSTTD